MPGTKAHIDNLEVDPDGNFVLVSVNPKIYPLEIVYSAAYVFIDRAYVILDGDVSDEIFVELRPKSGQDPMTLGREFNNELLNYAASAVQSLRSQNVRDAIVQRAFVTNSGAPAPSGDFRSDPKGIASLWKQPEQKG